MNNPYVSLSPQQRMAQALQQQGQQGMQQGMQQMQAPQQQSPLQNLPSMVQMYMRNKQMQGGMPQAPQAPQGYNPPTGMLSGD